MQIVVLIIGILFIGEGGVLLIGRKRVARNLPERSRFPRAGSTRSVALFSGLIFVVGVVLVTIYFFPPVL